MGIHDREYYQSTGHGRGPLASITSTAVGTLILVNVFVWFIQAFTMPVGGGLGPVTDLLVARPADVFGGLQLWRLLTANFAHDPQGMPHILWNMLFLFFFGRDVERIYGKKDFCLLYLGSGVIAIFAELLVLAATDLPAVPVLGASGAVMAVLLVFTLFYPTRTVLVFLVIPLPVWVLSLMFVVGDLSGAFARANAQSGVANFAHLTGFLMGFLFRYCDLRWVRLKSFFGRLFGSRGRVRTRAGARRDPQVIPFRREARESDVQGEVAEISQRIDRLLEKISTEGKESLTAEELEFLKENSAKYRSPES